MKFVFDQFVAEVEKMPDDHVAVKVLEATEGYDSDRNVVPVATGQEFHLRVSPEVALEWAFELAIAGGFMEDTTKPKVADLAEMRSVIEQRRKGKEQ